MIKYERFICEICGEVYESEQEALECESKGLEKKIEGIDIGSYIYFKDCEETPYAYGWQIVHNDYMTKLYAYQGGYRQKYKIEDIIYEGHKIKYIINHGLAYIGISNKLMHKIINSSYNKVKDLEEGD